MPEFHETGYGRRFFESQFPRLIEALESLASAAHALTESAERIANQLERIEPIGAELEETAPGSGLTPEQVAALELAEQERKATNIQVPKDQANAALMGINVRPLVCPECEGFLSETHDSPEEWFCSSCQSYVNGIEALMASDDYYERKEKRVPDTAEMMSAKLQEWEDDDPITGVMRAAGLLPACPKCRGKLAEPEPNRFRCVNCGVDVPINEIASIPAEPEKR